MKLCERARRGCEEAASLLDERRAILDWMRQNLADLRAKAGELAPPDDGAETPGTAGGRGQTVR